jgi:glycosyltransferase involved in cell wall biosynthesis
LQGLLRRSIRNAAAVTAASDATAAWLHRRYGIDPPVIPPGIDPFFLEPGADGSAEPYVLHPATGDSRENTDLVLRALAAVRPPARLILVGTTRTQAASLIHRCAQLGITSDAIRIEEWVSDDRLRDLYRGAVALVHPARYEGFVGLQPLEAMAQGTPVIALASPGVAGALDDVACLVDDDPKALGSAILRLATDATERATLGALGQEFARKFTWDRAARAVVAVLDGFAGVDAACAAENVESAMVYETRRGGWRSNLRSNETRSARPTRLWRLVPRPLRVPGRR